MSQTRFEYNAAVSDFGQFIPSVAPVHMVVYRFMSTWPQTMVNIGLQIIFTN